MHVQSERHAPSILCIQDSDYIWIIGVLCYPVIFFAVVLYSTVRYLYLVAFGKSVFFKGIGFSFSATPWCTQQGILHWLSCPCFLQTTRTGSSSACSQWRLGQACCKHSCNRGEPTSQCCRQHRLGGRRHVSLTRGSRVRCPEVNIFYENVTWVMAWACILMISTLLCAIVIQRYAVEGIRAPPDAERH